YVLPAPSPCLIPCTTLCRSPCQAYIPMFVSSEILSLVSGCMNCRLRSSSVRDFNKAVHRRCRPFSTSSELSLGKWLASGSSVQRSEEPTSELQSRENPVWRP